MLIEELDLSWMEFGAAPPVSEDTKSRLVISSDLCFEFIEKPPNVWRRFWTRFLLGWRWVDLTKGR